MKHVLIIIITLKTFINCFGQINETYIFEDYRHNCKHIYIEIILNTNDSTFNYVHSERNLDMCIEYSSYGKLKFLTESEFILVSKDTNSTWTDITGSLLSFKDENAIMINVSGVHSYFDLTQTVLTKYCPQKIQFKLIAQIDSMFSPYAKSLNFETNDYKVIEINENHLSQRPVSEGYFEKTLQESELLIIYPDKYEVFSFDLNNSSVANIKFEKESEKSLEYLPYSDCGYPQLKVLTPVKYKNKVLSIKRKKAVKLIRKSVNLHGMSYNYWQENEYLPDNPELINELINIFNENSIIEIYKNFYDSDKTKQTYRLNDEYEIINIGFTDNNLIAFVLIENNSDEQLTQIFKLIADKYILIGFISNGIYKEAI